MESVFSSDRLAEEKKYLPQKSTILFATILQGDMIAALVRIALEETPPTGLTWFTLTDN